MGIEFRDPPPDQRGAKKGQPTAAGKAAAAKFDAAYTQPLMAHPGQWAFLGRMAAGRPWAIKQTFAKRPGRWEVRTSNGDGVRLDVYARYLGPDEAPRG